MAVIAVGGLAVLLALPSGARAQGKARLGALVAEAEAMGVRTGVLVQDLRGSGPLYQRRAAVAYLPASNMKLLSAAATLAGLGAGFRFTTGFRLRQGWLEAVAGGDPNWITGGEDDPGRIFEALATALRRQGVSRVRGVRAVAGSFTGPSRPSGWPRDQLENYYCAPTGGLVLEQGCFRVRVAPGPGGRAAAEIVAPPARRPMTGSIALTGARGKTWGVRDSGKAVQLFGKLYRRANEREGVAAVADPAVWFCAATERGVSRAGILVDPAAVARDLELPPYRSDLLPALRRSLRESSNFAAEQCVRVLGAERGRDGSLAGGIDRMAAELRGLVGNLPAGVVFADASGLSRGNRVTPHLLVAVMREVLRAELATPFLSCMAVPGKGTLKKRFLDSPVKDRVHAKTGWIRGASALSGVLETADGRLRVFSILMNYDASLGGLNSKLKKLQERMVEAMDRLEN